MHRKCCIPGCNSSSKHKIVMHKMPAASEKVMLWHKTMSAAPFTIFEGRTWVEIGKLYVCHNHFEAKYVSSKGILKPNACPTLFTPEEITRGTPANTSDETDDTIHLNGQCLRIVYDPPHLIKGIRNNFLTKDIIMEGKTSKWQDLVDVYCTDCRHAQARLLHKLNDKHILPEKIKKMKVKNCVCVFSKTMAAALSYTASFSHYADGRPVSATLANTAELVTFFDDLFDSVNGATTHHKHTRGKKLRTAVTENSALFQFRRNRKLFRKSAFVQR